MVLVVLAAFGLWAVVVPTVFADGRPGLDRFEPLLLMSPLGVRKTAFFFNI